MVDVVFLLLLFFMVATNFSELERNIELELPNVAAEGTVDVPVRSRIVTVLADGQVELDGEPLTCDQLTQHLIAARSRTSDETTVVVQGDARCEYGRVASALGACRNAGISDLAVTVRLAEPSDVGHSTSSK
jgi:biopolymer transport protein ExbD